MFVKINPRDVSTAGLTAWANQTLDERLLDRLGDIIFAAEEIVEKVRIEAAAPPFPDFEQRMQRFVTEALAVMDQLRRS